MGGSALKSCKLSRLPRAQYLVTESEVLRTVSQHFSKVRVPRYLDSKPDFGDVDCVCMYRENWDQSIATIAAEFGSKEVVRTGQDTVSLERNEFQIDLIIVPAELFECCVNYLSFGDAGALIGRIAHQHGLSYGHNGLRVPVFATDKPDRHLKTIVASVDPYTILEYLGFDTEKWKSGFVNEEEVFEFVAQSRYFDPKLWVTADFDHRNRTRQRKRGMFQRWIEYVEKLPPAAVEKVVPELPDAIEYFGLTANRDAVLAAEAERIRIAELERGLDGETVMKITGLGEGKLLGQFLKVLSADLPVEERLDESKVKAFYDEWKSKRV